MKNYTQVHVKNSLEATEIYRRAFGAEVTLEIKNDAKTAVDLSPREERRKLRKRQKLPLTYLLKYSDFLGFWLGLVPQNIDACVDLLPVIMRTPA